MLALCRVVALLALEAAFGLGRITALQNRSSTLSQIR
jgi:hypothetical protein